MNTGKIFAIGDIHGTYNKLVQLFEEIEKEYTITDDDTVIFLGDYIDRGDNSYEVIEFLLSLPYKNIVFLKGNHEDMFLHHIRNGERDPLVSILFLQNGGVSTINSYRENGIYLEHNLPQSHAKFFTSLKLSYETDDYFFCHAGVDPRNALDDQNDDTLMWIRGEFISCFNDFGKIIVFGHTIQPFGPLTDKNKIGIDTGAYKDGGHLTCLVLPDRRFIQAQCLN